MQIWGDVSRSHGGNPTVGTWKEPQDQPPPPGFIKGTCSVTPPNNSPAGPRAIPLSDIESEKSNLCRKGTKDSYESEMLNLPGEVTFHRDVRCVKDWYFRKEIACISSTGYGIFGT